MTRRQILQIAAASSVWAQNGNALARNLGGAPAGFPVRFRVTKERNEPFDFVDYCHKLGLGVVETRLDPKDPENVRRLRDKVEKYGMRLILDFRLPREEKDVAEFEASMKGAREAGVISLRSALTQRRYEQYPTFAAFRDDFARCQKMVELAEPALRKYKVKLGLENHKGWRSAEQAAWLKRVGSEWVGVHFDFGNNLALCETPEQTLENLKPYVFASHIKDMALEMYDDGYLLSEVPLGEGILPLKKMVDSLRGKDATMAFDLEMITRDPLKIPVFTKQYWATFDDQVSPLPGRDLAQVLHLVRRNPPKSALPRTSGLSADAQLALEDKCIAQSIAYAKKNLALG